MSDELERIVREVVKTLAEKGLISLSASKTDAPAAKMNPTPEKTDAPKPALTPDFQTMRQPRVTIGTAGKLFSGEPGAWNPLPKPGPVRMDDGGHSHNVSCPSCKPLAQLSEKEVLELGADRVGVCHPTQSCDPIARMIDHTLLKPNATQEEIGKLCEEAKKYCFASVCVNPSYVALSAQLLRGSGVKVCTVIGFPLGSTTPTVKAIEARDAMANGADEIDMVINVGAVKSGNFQAVFDDIGAVRDATRGKVLKVILETSLLTREEKIKACQLSKEAGADFVKTSTGFSSGGATIEDIQLMRQTVGPQMGIKASGGVRDTDFARKLVSAGATRLGASASVAIATGKSAGEGKY